MNLILYGIIGGIGEDKLLVGDEIVGRKIRGKEGYSFSTVALLWEAEVGSSAML